MFSTEPTNVIQNFLSTHVLFSACSEELLDWASQNCRLISFHPGDELKSYDEKPFLCMILTGSARVFAKDRSSDLLLRILHAGDTFGVATLFGHTGESAITKILAAEATDAICMSEDTVKELITNDSAFAMRYIDFLADRIRFLNKRISCIGAGSAEDKLCTWLLNHLPDGEDVSMTLSMSLSRLAESLGLGRASLYRALDELETHGILERNGKKLHVPCRSALKTFGKTEHH